MGITTLGLSNTETRSHNPLENPVVPLGSRAGWSWLLGNRESDAAEVVSPYTSQATGTVQACTRLLSSAIAQSLPILYQKSGAGRIEATSNTLYSILAVESNPFSNAFTLWEAFAMSLISHGNAFLQIQRDGTGKVLNLWYLRPETMTLAWQNGALVYRTTMGMESGFREIQPADIIHCPWGAKHDGLVGISPLLEARNTTGVEIAMERFNARFYANFAVPQIALLTKASLKPETKVQMRQGWEELQRGSNQHRVAILDQELDIKTLGATQEDSQYLDSRKFSREQICGLFGLKPSQIGSEARTSSETYAGEQLSFLVDCLNPHLTRIRLELQRKLLNGRPDLEIQHDTSDRLRLDVESQMKMLSIGRTFGILTANEARKQLGLSPVAGADNDTLMVPANQISAQRLLNPVTPTAVTAVEEL